MLKRLFGLRPFEKRVGELLARAGCEVLSMIFETPDERLMQERDRNLRVVGFRDRTIVTVFGDIKIRRRLYEDKVTRETRFLLDERLGLEKRDRVSAGVKDLAVRLSTEMPFRRAADVLSEITPGIVHEGMVQAMETGSRGVTSDGRVERYRAGLQGGRDRSVAASQGTGAFRSLP